MINYLWWVPITILYYFIFSYLSKEVNVQGGKWTWIAFTWGALCPLWIIVARISKNLVFDGMLYDNIMFITFVTTMIFLGEGSKFVTSQWIGLFFVVIGSILMRYHK